MLQNNLYRKGFFFQIHRDKKVSSNKHFSNWDRGHPVVCPVPTNSLPNYRFAAIESQRQVKPFHV